VKVSVITCTNRPHMIDNVFRNYVRQQWKDKELIVVLNNDAMDLNAWRKKADGIENVTIYRIPEKRSLGYCLNDAVKRAKFPYIAKFDDDDYYGPNFLTRAMGVFRRHPRVSVVGQKSFYTYFPHYRLLVLRHGKRVAGATLVFKKAVMEKVRFSRKRRGTDTSFKRRCEKKGLIIRSMSPGDYACMRRPGTKHTWDISDSEFLKSCTDWKSTENFTSIVNDASARRRRK